jgi:transposase InsO family protein
MVPKPDSFQLTPLVVNQAAQTPVTLEVRFDAQPSAVKIPGGMGIVWLAPDAPRPVSAVKRSPKNGRYFRTLTVVDQYTRECPFLEAAHSLTAAKVAHALDTVVAKRGYPESITWTPAASFAAE